MDFEKTKNELKQEIECAETMLLVMGFITVGMLVMGLIMQCLEGWIFAGGFGGCSFIATMVSFSCLMSDKKKIKRLEQTKNKFDEIDKQSENFREQMEMKLMEKRVYSNLRFREAVLKDKFFGITNKKLQEEFLQEQLGMWTNGADAIKQFENYMFDYREEFDEKLDEYQRKQAILNDYAQEKSNTKKTTQKSGRYINIIEVQKKRGRPAKKKRGRPRKQA